MFTPLSVISHWAITRIAPTDYGTLPLFLPVQVEQPSEGFYWEGVLVTHFVTLKIGDRGVEEFVDYGGSQGLHGCTSLGGRILE